MVIRTAGFNLMTFGNNTNSWKEWYKYQLYQPNMVRFLTSGRWKSCSAISTKPFFHSFELKILQYVRPLWWSTSSCISSFKFLQRSRSSSAGPLRTTTIACCINTVSLFTCSTHTSGSDKELQSATWGQRWMTQGEKAFSFPSLPKCSVTVLG